MDLTTARNYFPHIKDGLIYFNHAATGPLSTKVTEKLNEYIDERSRKWIDNFPKVSKIADSAKNDLAKMLNCSSERIAYTDNTTTGINIIANGTKWKSGDRILLNNIEFPANVYPFLNLKKQGVEIDFIKANDGIVSAEDIIENIKPGTKLVSISFVQFLTGYKINLEKIGKYCKENEIILCVDAIQGLGALRLDVKKCNIDFLSCGTQKWMLGLQGLAFIYLTEELQKNLNMKYIGWLSVKDAWNILDYNLVPLDSAERFQNGTICHIGVYALRGALDLFQEFGWDTIENQVIENAQYLSHNLDEIGFKTILGNCPKECISGIVTFRHENSQKVFDHLTENKISGAVREGMVRLSPHFYNSREECDKVITILKDFNN